MKSKILPPSADANALFRRLIAKHHPDRGGDADTAQKIIHARGDIHRLQKLERDLSCNNFGDGGGTTDAAEQEAAMKRVKAAEQEAAMKRVKAAEQESVYMAAMRRVKAAEQESEQESVYMAAMRRAVAEMERR